MRQRHWNQHHQYGRDLQKKQGLKFCKVRKSEARSTNAGLKSWTPDANLTDTEFATLCKDRKYGSDRKPNIKLTSEDWNAGHMLKAQTWAIKFYRSWASDTNIKWETCVKASKRGVCHIRVQEISKEADLKFSKLWTPNASLAYKTYISSLKTWCSPCSRLKNLRLKSQQARVLSDNARVAFAEHGRIDLKSTV